MYTEYSKIKGWYRLISIAVIEGNIGSGKSTILSELQARGHEVALEPLHIWDCPEESNLHSNVICLEDYNGKRCSLLKATYSWLRNRDPNRKGIRLLNLIKTQIMFNVSLLSIQIDTLTSVLTKTFGENFHLQTQRPFASEKKLVFFERSAYTVRELFLPNMVSAWDELNGVEQQLCAGPLKLLYDLVDICVAFFGMQFNYIQTDTVPPEDLLLRIKTRSRLTGTDSQNDITPEYLVDLERRLTDLPKKFEHDRQIFFKLIKDGH